MSTYSITKSFIAIDAGYKNIGLAHFKDSNVQKTYIMTAENFYTHFVEFSNLLDVIIPDVVIFEKPVYDSKSLASGYKVIETMGVQKCLLQKKNINYFEVSPTEVKYQIAGTGKANKEDVKNSIIAKNLYTESKIIEDIKQNSQFNYKKELQYHLWDAIAIGFTYLKKHE